MSRQLRFITFVFFSVGAVNALAQPAPDVPAFASDQVIVAFEPGVSGLAIANAHSQAGAAPLRGIDAIGAVVTQVPAGNVPAAVAAYTSNPNVRYAEPNYLRPLVLPNEGSDTALGIDYFDEQYGLHNTGQSFYYDPITGELGAVSGMADADIDAPEAWDLHTGSPFITVAVLDSGVDCNHADLVGKCGENINLGPSETLADELGHGTHVAGIIGATGNNGVGVAGVSWHTMLASIKVCYEHFDLIYGLIGLCDAAASAEGIIHAADSGYQIINMSYGGPTGSRAEADAAEYAWSQGSVLVAAAANGYEPTPMYPAAFPNVIAVAATDWFDNLAGFSNFGDWVSLAAPGHHILGTLPHALCGISESDPEGCYGWLSGTSMASPTVAGAAALVWAYMGGGGSNSAVREALEANADTTGAMGQNMLAWTRNGRLNVYGALTGSGSGSDPEPPPTETGVHVGDLDGESVNQGSTWVAEVTVHVHDENEQPVNGLLVQGTWSGGLGAASCETAGGQCAVLSESMPKRVGSATFSVTDISGGTYIAGANHDPEDDSDGSSITVAK